MMTIQDVLDRVKKVQGFRHDPEAAHSTEDDLWRDVLREIAKGRTGKWCEAAADAALKTDAIEFERWCA